jgi:MFS transporter, PPP family, 3-phenylpropionic acid transporter
MAAGRRILLAYVVYFGAIGASFPYLPVFYRDLGLTLQEIGILTAIQAATQLVLGPMWGGLVDRFPRTRLTLPLAAIVATAGALDLFLSTDFVAVLVGSMLLYAGLAGIGPTLDARTLETLGPGRRDRYGQVRAFGSMSFVLATLFVGLLLSARGSRSLFWVYVPALLGTVIVTSTISRRGSNRPVSLFRGATEILSAPGMLRLFAGFTVVWTALTALNAFYSIQIVALGGDTSLVGIAWAFGAAVEVPLMYAFPRLGARFGTERLLVLGAVAMALRAVLAASAAVPFGLVIIAPLEGFAFACVFVGGVTVLASRIPASLGGTVQGLFSASAGLATIIGSIAGGTIAGAVGIPALFAACSALGLAGAGILALAVLGRRTPRVEARPGREPTPTAPGTAPTPPGSEAERTVPALKVD